MGDTPPFLWRTVDRSSTHGWICRDCTAKGEWPDAVDVNGENHVKMTGHHVTITHVSTRIIEGIAT